MGVLPGGAQAAILSAGTSNGFMMRILGKISVCLMAFLVGAPVPAGAQSSWPNGQFHGEGLIAGGSQRGGSDGGFLFGDFSLGVDIGRFEIGLGMLGVVGRRHETYATLGYHAPDGAVWSLGLPRPAFDHVAQGAVLHLLPHLAVDTIGETHSRLTFGAMTLSGYLPVGVAYERETDRGTHALSLHYLPSGGEIVAGAGFALKRGRLTWEGAVEVVSAGSTKVNGKLRLVTQAGRASFSAAYFNAPANGSGGIAEVAVDWKMSDRVLLTGFHDQAFGSGVPNRTGIAAQIDLGAKFIASVAAVRDGGSNVVGAYLGRRF